MNERIQHPVLDQLPVVIYSRPLDPGAPFIYVNARIQELLGWRAHSFTREPGFWQRLLHPEDRGRVFECWRQRLQTGEAFAGDYRMAGRDGQFVWVRDQALVVTDEDGRPTCLRGVMLDITVDKETELTLRRREQKYRLLFTSGRDAIFVHQPTAAGEPAPFIEINETACRRYGYTRKEFLRLTPVDLAPPEKAADVRRRVKQLLTERHILFETVHLSKHGERIPVEISSHLFELDGTPTVLSIARDISERKKAQEMFAKAFHASPFPMVISRKEDCKIIDVNQTFLRLFELDRHEVVGASICELGIWPDPEVRQQLLARLAEGGQIHNVETKFVTSAGTSLWINYSGETIEVHGEPCILVIGDDVTSRRLAEERLLAYQEQLRRLASELVLSEERARRQLAMDLHDSIGQILAMAKIKVDTLEQQGRQSAAAEILADLNRYLTEAIRQTRTLSFELSPPLLYEFGLEAALESLVETMAAEHGIEIHYTDDGIFTPLSEDTAVLLFRAARECLLNVIRHARATRARLAVSHQADKISIEIEDDGVGFCLDDTGLHTSKNGHLGLFGIKERCHSLGGDIWVASAPEKGTKVTLAVPLQPKRA